MTHYLAHARQPIEACAELVELDIEAYAPAAVDVIRPPKVHKWVPKVYPILPTVILVSLSPAQWHEARGIICTVCTVCGIAPREWDRQVMPFVARARADFDERMSRIEAGEHLAKYKTDDALDILGGPFIGKVARFVRIKTEAEFPTIMASINLFGRSCVLPFDARDLQESIA